MGHFGLYADFTFTLPMVKADKFFECITWVEFFFLFTPEFMKEYMN